MYTVFYDRGLIENIGRLHSHRIWKVDNWYEMAIMKKKQKWLKTKKKVIVQKPIFSYTEQSIRISTSRQLIKIKLLQYFR